MATIYICVLCDREGGRSTRHHLVPVSITNHRKISESEQVRVCRKCHSDIHYYFSHWELEQTYHTVARLRPELEKRKQMSPNPDNDALCDGGTQSAESK